MGVDVVVWFAVGVAAGLLLAAWLEIGKPPVAGELIIDTHDWNVDKYNMQFNQMSLIELEEYKYVALKITQAVIVDDRDYNNDFNDTD